MVFEILAAIILSFAAFTLFLKNKALKNFFFLMTILMVIVSLAVSLYGKEIIETSSSTTIKYYQIPGGDALLFGFGLVLIVMLVIVMLQITFRIFGETI